MTPTRGIISKPTRKYKHANNNSAATKKGPTMNPLTQFKKISILPLLIAPTLVVLAALTALPARADPPQVCRLSVRGLIDPNGNPNQAAQFAEIMSYTKIGDWKAKINIDQFQLYVVEVTIQPGGWLGWHSHPGLSFVVVKSGTASFYEADDPTCTPVRMGPLGTFFEPAGDVHMVRNEEAVPLVNLVIQLTPPGAPRAIGESGPDCPTLTCASGQ
jgi:quercetin dioxygenase-like cupin family protein